MKILIVEDHPVDRKLAGLVLKISGHAVTEVISAETAIEAVAKERYDVVFLDLCLPGADGLMLVRMLKSNAANDHTAIVAVTAFEEKYPRQELIAAGVDACLVKPIDTRYLAATLESVVAGKA
jgi:CheY-like chemotaxis protein